MNGINLSVITLLTFSNPSASFLDYLTVLNLQSSIGELLRALRAEREQVNLNHLFTQLDFARFYEHLFPELAETPHTNKKSYYFGGKFA
jgi:hypothetical protein